MDGSMWDLCGMVRPDMLQVDTCVLRTGSLVTYKSRFPPLPTTRHSPLSIRFALSMGRRPWATATQREFLHSYVPGLPAAKLNPGLNIYYGQITQDFLERWELEPVITVPPLSPEELRKQSVARLGSVCVLFNVTTLRSSSLLVYC